MCFPAASVTSVEWDLFLWLDDKEQALRVWSARSWQPDGKWSATGYRGPENDLRKKESHASGHTERCHKPEAVGSDPCHLLLLALYGNLQLCLNSLTSSQELGLC